MCGAHKLDRVLMLIAGRPGHPCLQFGAGLLHGLQHPILIALSKGTKHEAGRMDLVGQINQERIQHEGVFREHTSKCGMAHPTRPSLPLSSSPSHSLGALFVDYENLYYFLKDRLEFDLDPSEIALEALRNLQKHLRDVLGIRPIVQLAYGDFERIHDGAMNSLQLTGIDVRHVVGTEHKNAADMRMCIDCLHSLHLRSEIDHFILVTGDRDFIPVIQYLNESAKEVRVAAYRAQASGDLLRIITDEMFIDIHKLAPSASFKVQESRSTPSAQVPKPVAPAVVTPPPPPPPFRTPVRLDDQYDIVALEIMLENYHDKREVWLKPYLYKLADKLPELEDFERKQLISHLEEAGAVRMVQREGNTGPYRVLIINWNHPDVQAANP